MLLVGSVYTDHYRSKQWYDLQMKYLKKTTKNFVHVVYLNGNVDFFNDSIVIKKNTDYCYPANHCHIRGLNEIVEYFLNHNNFENILILDNDCFPIDSNWQNNLLQSMMPFDVASVVRYENLDNFAHPCVFFAKRNIAKKLKFDFYKKKNLMGRYFEETSSNIIDFFPLVRSNKINYHPILYGIYWNTFYHHGSGSRILSFRSFDDKYYHEIFNQDKIEEKIFLELVDNPEKFLNNLKYNYNKRKIF